MQARRRFVFTGIAAATATVAGLFQWRASAANPPAASGAFPYVRSDAQWRQTLDKAQYEVLRHADTERPYSSPLNDEHRTGTFACAGCKQKLFSSSTKFDSHTGWPSFWAPLEKAVATGGDNSFGMSRTEVHCTECGGHLGHVFDDGPKPTGLRYCMNGVAMTFKPGSA
jgi:peptide-methionine (R)-S-oxide reductase